MLVARYHLFETKVLALLLADSWPDRFDLLILVGYLGVFVGVPVVGYALLAIDVRTHYRRLRGALVVISSYAAGLPRWVAQESWSGKRPPTCLAVFGLQLPCSEQELLEAYRQRVKELHPDRGGERDDFLQLQRYFEEARSLLTDEEVC